VLIQLLAFQYNLHKSVMRLVKTGCAELVSKSFCVIALICASDDSSHVINFVNLDIIDLIKQRLVAPLEFDAEIELAINASFALSNIVADSDCSAQHAVLRSNIFELALIPLLQKPNLSELLRYELVSAVGNFFIHLDFDLCYYLIHECAIIPCIVEGLQN
jgi:hypothetical protein